MAIGKIKITKVDRNLDNDIEVHWQCGTFDGIETFRIVATPTLIVERIKGIVLAAMAEGVRDVLKEYRSQELQKLKDELEGKEIPLFEDN